MNVPMSLREFVHFQHFKLLLNFANIPDGISDDLLECISVRGIASLTVYLTANSRKIADATYSVNWNVDNELVRSCGDNIEMGFSWEGYVAPEVRVVLSRLRYISVISSCQIHVGLVESPYILKDSHNKLNLYNKCEILVNATGPAWECEAETSVRLIDAIGSATVTTHIVPLSALHQELSIRKSAQNRIFISWSGNISKELAKCLKNILELKVFVGTGLRCFVSDVDIASGGDWWGIIHEELKRCNLGILCATSENLPKSEWVFYEVGGMLTRDIPVIPLLFDCKVELFSNTPLAAKQMVNMRKKDNFSKMIGDINKQLSIDGISLTDLQEEQIKIISDSCHDELLNLFASLSA